MRINWECPSLRPGIWGSVDKFIGPGATRAEIMLQTVVPLLGAAAALGYAKVIQLNWSILQQCACALIAVDTMGGVVTNATSAAKRCTIVRDNL